MNKRDYPLFIIDRTKSDNYPDDYVVCLDREAGFAARVVYFPEQSAYQAFVENFNNRENAEISGVHFPLKKGGGVVLQLVDFLYHFELTNDIKSRIKTLLKKALKKYLHAEKDRTPDKEDLSIENQIKQQRLTIEQAVRNYDELLRRAGGDKQTADYQIDLAKETLKTLEKYRDNMLYFTVNMN